MSETYRIQWAPIATEDLDDILDFIAVEKSPETAIRIYERIRSRVDSLKSYPRRGRVVPELKDIGLTEYRELISTPYRIFYRITGRLVSILGVLDGRRDLEEILIRRAIGSFPPK